MERIISATEALTTLSLDEVARISYTLALTEERRRQLEKDAARKAGG